MQYHDSTEKSSHSPLLMTSGALKIKDVLLSLVNITYISGHLICARNNVIVGNDQETVQSERRIKVKLTIRCLY